MASIVLGGMALAAYFSIGRLGCSADVETHRNAHQAPDNWLQALYLFSEALRCAQRRLKANVVFERDTSMPCEHCHVALPAACRLAARLLSQCRE